MSKQKEQPAHSALPRFETPANMMQHQMQMATSMFGPMMAMHISMLNWNAHTCKRMAEAYSNWFGFVGHRLEEDANLAQQFQVTRDPQELSQVCSKFFETAAKDYQHGLTSITKLSTRMAEETVDEFEEAGQRTRQVMEQHGGITN